MDGRMFRYILFACIAVYILGSVATLYKVYYNTSGRELWNKIDPIYEHSKISFKSTSYLFLGDSRIAQWEIPDSVISSNHRLNIGIEGQTSSQVLQRAKDYFTKNHSDYAIIQVGINDLKLIGYYPERDKYIVSLTIKNIKELLETCTKHQSIPLFITIIPPGTVELKRVLFWNKKVNNAVIQVNKAIVSYCGEKKIKVLNASELLSDDGFVIRKEYERGCLHLNEKGYKTLNSELVKIIKEHILH